MSRNLAAYYWLRRAETFGAVGNERCDLLAMAQGWSAGGGPR